ncbi:MAG: hypothetical protein ACK55I_22765, partial [bacterium]
AGRARGVEEREDPGAAPPVCRTGDLEVIDLHRNACATPHLERFPHGFHDGHAFIPHVRDVDPAMARRHLGQRYHLIECGVGGRDVFEPGREPQCALLHGGIYERPHPVELHRGWRAIVEPHHALADPGVSREEPHIGGH